MGARKKTNDSWKHAVLRAGLCAGLGLLLLSSSLRDLSYDLLACVHAPGAPPEVVIIYMDDYSFNQLQQATTRNWDLNLHAGLLDQLTRDHARVVVFDVVFNDLSPAPSRARFAQAIKRNGKVVLAAGNNPEKRPGFEVTGPVMPLPELEDAAAGWGIAATRSARESMSRQYYAGNELHPSLPWAAARVAGADVTKGPPGARDGSEAREPDTWLNYYGPALTIPHLSYDVALIQQPGFFTNKCVFIGALPKTLRAMQEADVFRTPHSLLPGAAFFPGVELGATAFLNLWQRDWLTQWPESTQALAVLLAGALAGAALGLMRPWPASVGAVAGIIAVLVVAAVAYSHHVWFGWTVIAFAQIPAALAWSIGGGFVRIKFEREVLQRTLDETTRLVEATKATAAQKPAFFIPDHSMVRLVGRGAYGEVWLARNVIGAYHVVKLIKRRGFPSDEPYEREFRGIQKFMPVSRSHPGFVHILHVGRNDDEKFYYCIMEAGDDRTSGQQIDPDTYQPKTLQSVMEERGRLPPDEGLQLGLALSDALEHLHRQQLIHRDIKPPNIIYVRGAPKFADIGLVTDIGGPQGQVSQVGTEGYLAPEGPGTPGADVYALGKVLYEAVMGRDRRLFPEVPTAVFEQPEESLLRRLNGVIFRACESDPERRYRTAGQLHDDLKTLEARF